VNKRGSILVGVLWCLTLLSVIVIGVLYTGRMDLKVTKNYGDSTQAYYLALAGVEKAKALIYQDAAQRKRSAQNHSGSLYNDPADFRDVRLGRGEFRVMRAGVREEGSAVIYGISDEESRLSINDAGKDELVKLYGMTPETAAAIMDWRDSDNEASQGGAEAEYYAAMRPPYLPRNARIQTIRELLQVKDITPAMLLGEDRNANGILDPEENDGNATFPPDNQDGILDNGWSGEICFESAVQNQSAAGQDRVNVQTADESTLTGVQGITQEIAKAIVAYRDQNKLESISDLLGVRAMTPARQNGNSANEQNGEQQRQQSQPTGPELINEDLLLQIADDVTTTDNKTEYGLVNINTAGPDILFCLPGMTEELAQAIVSYRSSSGYFQNTAYLLRVPGFTRDLLKRVGPRVTARSETFRIISEGRVNSGGAVRRVEFIVRLGSETVDTISYRELM
jgi:DNA uptake protein ComE-like DNA-binding protein